MSLHLRLQSFSDMEEKQSAWISYALSILLILLKFLLTWNLTNLIRFFLDGKIDRNSQQTQSACCDLQKSPTSVFGSTELGTVMGRLGMCYGECDLSDAGEGIEGLFEEEEPSLEEVRAAFDVFDENRDGFIDAVELQRVVSCLGIRGRYGVGEFRGMIGAADQNGDGLIDFKEFVTFMEICLGAK